MEKKETKRKNLKERGITLVALVVTIIILLILAGVTLNIALSENGLFQRAKGAAKRYENASENEAEILDNLDKTLAELNRPKIESSEVARSLKEYQGKYVDIGLDTNGNSKVDDWEIFYAGNGRIFLIAADYVPADNLKTWGIIGDTGSLKDNGFQQYSSDYKYIVNWSTPTRFLTLPTTPDKFSSLVMHTGYTLNDSNPNSIAVSHLLNTEAWSGIKEATDKKDFIDFVIGGPTLEMWCAAWKEAVNGDADLKPIEADPQASESGYNVKYGETSEMYMYVNGSTDYEPDTTKLDKYKTFFPHTTVVEDICYGYWLASPSSTSSTYAPKFLMYVEYDGLVAYYGYDNFFCSVRPVVSLRSGVKLVEKEPGGNEYDVVG